jgi:hypothetical protein
VQREAAIVRLMERWEVPERLLRRHKEGIERLILALSGEYLDERKLHDFEELLRIDPSTTL